MSKGKLKVGDLVVVRCDLMEEYSDKDPGVIIEITPPMVPNGGRRAVVFWGTEPKFGRSVEWDWEMDLEKVKK